LRLSTPKGNSLKYDQRRSLLMFLKTCFFTSKIYLIDIQGIG
jgi:hypothetical protein